ncbi:MAG TPA: TetR/AcrR family transcriptional regulator [Acidimicrobiales bacterium]|nr:TetR/AcrR family transcriptional regulator [Acidimicrobiales bacterium]
MRTSSLIIESAREVFLQKGYAGARIDDIAEEAGVSRASFYSYFPSKRDLLLELGRRTASAIDECLDEVETIAAKDGDDVISDIVRAYLRFLDVHGAFLLVWGQATFADESLARAGMKTRLVSARRFARILQRMRGVEDESDDDPARVGLALLVMMDRYWSYWRVNSFPFTEDQVVETLAGICRSVVDSF